MRTTKKKKKEKRKMTNENEKRKKHTIKTMKKSTRLPERRQQ